MTYNELRNIAKPYIRINANLPTNAFLILTQIGINFKNEAQCEEDYGGRMTPLYNVPAFLATKNNIKTIYFSSKTQYWNFYIFHEISHYLLGHDGDSPHNEMDADMLACILAAPIENLPTYLKSARDLSSLCQIPIDKAEMYWKEINTSFSKSHKPPNVIGITLLIFFIIVALFIKFSNIIGTNNKYDVTYGDTKENYTYSTVDGVPPTEDIYYITSSGIHYHKVNCQYIKNKTNIISITLEEANSLNLKPCKECSCQDK